MTDSEFPTLVSYAEVLGTPDQLYWLGYRYTSSSELQDVSGTVVDGSSAVLDINNNDGTASRVTADAGVCLAIGGGNGLLYRVQCSMTLPSFCQRRIPGEYYNIYNEIGSG